MKKRIASIILCLCMAITAFGFTACKEEDPGDPTGLSAEDQVRIAIETYRKILNDLSKQSNIPAGSPGGWSAEIDALFEQYSGLEMKNMDAGVYALYYQMAAPIIGLLEKAGTQSLSYEYSIQIEFENKTEEPVKYFLGDVVPHIISFVGVTQEDGYDVVYANLKLLPWGLSDDQYLTHMTLKSFYKTDSDYGCEFIITENSEGCLGYQVYRDYISFKKNNWLRQLRLDGVFIDKFYAGDDEWREGYSNRLGRELDEILWTGTKMIKDHKLLNASVMPPYFTEEYYDLYLPVYNIIASLTQDLQDSALCLEKANLGDTPRALAVSGQNHVNAEGQVVVTLDANVFYEYFEAIK